MLAISSLSVGCKNIVLSLSFERCLYLCIFYAFLCSFGYRDKVIIKGVSNTIRIGYSITIIKRENTVGILDATVFREIKDVIPFHVFLIFSHFFQNYCHNNKPVYFSS